MDWIKLWVEHVVYPLMERFTHNRVRACTAALLATERTGAAQVQLRRLAEHLNLCARHVPAFRALRDVPVDADPFGALRTLAPLAKAAIRRAPEQFRNEEIPAHALIENRSGGSTGEPLRFFMTRQNVEWYEAARWRGLSWWNITFGSRCLMVWGAPVELGRMQLARFRLRERFLKNRVILSAYGLDVRKADAYARLLRRFRPEYLYGYASALCALAQILPAPMPELRLKAVVSTAETLAPEQRALLARTFACPVVNEYGARDAGILAFECPCGRMHLTQENAVLEILDPVTHAPVPPGTAGTVAVTDLTNDAMPRPRYLLGDIAALDPAPCPCGRRLPVLCPPEGREDALLQLPDGTLVHGSLVDKLSRRYGSVRQVRLEQNDPGHAELLLVQTMRDAEQAQALLREVQARLPGVQVTLRTVSSIAPEPSGKRLCAARRFPLRRP